MVPLPLAVDLRDVHKSFGSGAGRAGEIALAVGAGEVMAFLARTGPGRTSTITYPGSVPRPDAGAGGRCTAMTPRQAVRKGLVAAVMQTGGLLKTSRWRRRRVHRPAVARSAARSPRSGAGGLTAMRAAGSGSAQAANSSGCGSRWR